MKWNERRQARAGTRSGPFSGSLSHWPPFVPRQAGRDPAAAAARRTCLCTRPCGFFTSSWLCSWWPWSCWPLWVSAHSQQHRASPGLSPAPLASLPGCRGFLTRGPVPKLPYTDQQTCAAGLRARGSQCLVQTAETGSCVLVSDGLCDLEQGLPLSAPPFSDR